ncbi:MAG TPA: TolC family protein, partial [Bacteroidales bacterium]|nr:TolC family protein [Bacteroidales bacterium]
QNRYNLMASQYDADQFMDDITLSIATGYLQILYAKEMLGIARNQLNITQQQVDRMKKLVAAGTLARGDLLLIEAQMATEELRYVEARNNLDIAYLTLRQMLDLPPGEPFEIQQPELEFYESRTMFMSPDQIYNFAKNHNPAIRSADFRIESAVKGLAIARGSQSPQLQMTATWGTGFSGAQKIGVDPFTQEIQIGYDSDMRPVYTLRPMFGSFEVKPFADQFSDNNNRTIDFRLTVPIFNGWFTRSTIDRAKIAVTNAELESQSVQLQFNKTIQQAWADASASLKRHNASVKMVEATKESFQYAEQKFNVGILNSFDYSNAKNDLQRAQSELLQAKFDYLFKTKVLDFYMGTPITL